MRGLGRFARRHARALGRISIWLVPLGFVLQIVSLAQQLTHLFAPAPGERPFVVAVFVAVVLLGIAGVAAGFLALPTPAGRRLGGFGAALGAALLVLFLVASAVLWNTLAALG